MDFKRFLASVLVVIDRLDVKDLSTANVFCSFIIAFVSEIIMISVLDNFWIFIYPEIKLAFIFIIMLPIFWLSLKFLPK